MLGGTLVLFLVTLMGIYIACRVFDYQISSARKVGAATCFAVLNIIPLSVLVPFLNLLLPPIALYVCLMDQYLEHGKVTKVFALTFLIAVSAIAFLYSSERTRQTAIPDGTVTALETQPVR